MLIRNTFLLAYLLVFQASAITLNNGRYEDIYIVIQDSIDENLELLDRIQDIFTKASELLFTATKQHVYFGKIKVIIPKSWSQQTNYQQMPALSSLVSYINVDYGRIESPYVRSRNCGEEGVAMYLHPSFLLNTGRTDYGNHENVIVHEWGHLRWGLFDEYPSRRANGGENFYQHAGKWKPVGCSHSMQGVVGRGGNCNTDIASWCDVSNTQRKMRSTCFFCPYIDQDLTVSLMAYQYIDKMALFCDKDDDSVPEAERHNSIAPNAQNKFCDHKSAWEIMREHDDFKDSEPLDEVDTTPEFEFIQESDIYRVLVLDVSGSMSWYNRIGLLTQAAEHLIQNRIPTGSWLGIVTFNYDASTKHEIIQVNTQEDRSNLIAALNISAGGGTCIACGINLAIDILTDTIGSPENGEVVLITDGVDTSQSINSARLGAIQAKVTINTIAVSQQADNLLADIALGTGGKSFTYLESGNISFAAVMAEAVSELTSITSAASQSALLLSERMESNVIRTTFSIENGLGRNTSVTVLTLIDDNIHVQLVGPGSDTQTVTAFGKTATMNIDGIAKVGDYTLTITTSALGQIVEYHVTSSPMNNTIDVIRVDSRLSKTNVDLSSGNLPIVYGDVTKGNAPVINATVKALVESSSGYSCTLDLYDNGIDPDREKNDGIYSSYILPKCLRNGRISIRIKASGKGGEIALLYSNTGAASMNAEEEEEVEETIIDSFQRNDVTEELVITNYIYDESVDSIAPGRITDVEINNIETVTSQNGENRNLTLTWTATGDDKNQGQATSYEMRISSDIDTLRDDFESAETFNMTNSTIDPQIVGTEEALKLVVNAEESYIETVYFAVRAVDEVGNKGPVSNIVSIIVARGFRATGERGYPASDIVFDNPDASSSKPRNEDVDIIAIIIGTTVPCGVVLFVVIIFFFVKKIKQQKASVSDSQVSIISKGSSMTEVLPFKSSRLERAFASTSLPISLPKHASPQIPSEPAGYKKQGCIQNKTTDQTLPNSSCNGNENDGCSSKANIKDETVVNMENESTVIVLEQNKDSKFKNEKALDIDEDSQEFTDPDGYITQMIGKKFPAVNIPFHRTNKCESLKTVDPKAAFDNDIPDVKVVDSADKDKVLENFPALPFSYGMKRDCSHPPPNMAPHILEPGGFRTGMKPYVFPSPFSGVQDSFKNTTKDEVNTDDCFDDTDLQTENDAAQSEKDSLWSLEYPDNSSEINENESFESDDGELADELDGEMNLNRVEDGDDFGVSEYVSIEENKFDDKANAEVDNSCKDIKSDTEEISEGVRENV